MEKKHLPCLNFTVYTVHHIPLHWLDALLVVLTNILLNPIHGCHWIMVLVHTVSK